MREYSKIYPKIWAGTDAQRLRHLGATHLLVALYCMTSQHANMLGIYHLPLYYVAYHTTLSLEVVQKCIRDLSEIGFCQYDENSEYIWVIDMACDQIETNLSEKDNRIKYIQGLYDSFPNELSFLEEFYDKYHERFHLNRRNLSSKPLRTPFGSPLKGVESTFDEKNETSDLKPLQSSFEAPSKPLQNPSEPPLKEEDLLENDQKIVINDPDCEKSDQNTSPFEPPSKPESRSRRKSRNRNRRRSMRRNRNRNRRKNRSRNREKVMSRKRDNFHAHLLPNLLFLLLLFLSVQFSHTGSK